MRIFDRYDPTEVKVNDHGLAKYINLEPTRLPYTNARHHQRFGKAKVSIVERLINNMMRTEHTTGHKFRAYNAVRAAFLSLEKNTKKNPIQILVNALENAAPREGITRLVYGGISVPKAIDISPVRRLDIALRNICIGAFKRSHKNKTGLGDSLANEIIATANGDVNTFAISKRDEVERIARSAR